MSPPTKRGRKRKEQENVRILSQTPQVTESPHATQEMIQSVVQTNDVVQKHIKLGGMNIVVHSANATQTTQQTTQQQTLPSTSHVPSYANLLFQNIPTLQHNPEDHCFIGLRNQPDPKKMSSSLLIHDEQPERKKSKENKSKENKLKENKSKNKSKENKLKENKSKENKSKENNPKKSIITQQQIPTVLPQWNQLGCPSHTDVCCFWCTHSFDTPPVSIPIRYKRTTTEEKFLVSGVFCSWNCAKAYAIDQRMITTTLISMLCHRMGGPLAVKSAPPRCVLRRFGGYMTIEEFREYSITVNLSQIHVNPPHMIMMIPNLSETSVAICKKKNKHTTQQNQQNQHIEDEENEDIEDEDDDDDVVDMNNDDEDDSILSSDEDEL